MIYTRDFFIANAESIVKLLALALTNLVLEYADLVTKLAKPSLGWGKTSKMKTAKQMEISIFCSFFSKFEKKSQENSLWVINKSWNNCSELRNMHRQIDYKVNKYSSFYSAKYFQSFSIVAWFIPRMKCKWPV